jgi:hypothetical protein
MLNCNWRRYHLNNNKSVHTIPENEFLHMFPSYLLADNMSRAAQTVTSVNCIRDIPGLYLGQYNDYTDWRSRGLPRDSKEIPESNLTYAEKASFHINFTTLFASILSFHAIKVELAALWLGKLQTSDNQARSQATNTVGAEASRAGAYMYIRLYAYTMLLHVHCIYIYISVKSAFVRTTNSTL